VIAPVDKVAYQNKITQNDLSVCFTDSDGDLLTITAEYSFNGGSS